MYWYIYLHENHKNPTIHVGKYNISMDGIRYIQASFSSSFQLTPSFLQVRAASRMRRSFMLRCVTIASMAFKSLADEDQKSEETTILDTTNHWLTKGIW